MDVSRFELRWRDRRVSGTQTPRRFLDVCVGGTSFYERHQTDFISCLGWVEDDRAAARLLGDDPPDVDDRVAVAVCPECGDLGCGAITVVIRREGDTIVWAAPAMSTPEAGTWHHDEDEFADWPELRFDVREYRSAITNRARPPHAPT